MPEKPDPATRSTWPPDHLRVVHGDERDDDALADDDRDRADSAEHEAVYDLEYYEEIDLDAMAEGEGPDA